MLLLEGCLLDGAEDAVADIVARCTGRFDGLTPELRKSLDKAECQSHPAVMTSRTRLGLPDQPPLRSRWLQCGYCRSDTRDSRSVEHVLPESLGNTTVVLPPGRICDACNNYFARKVEAPFLAASPVLTTRVQESVPSKRGTLPQIEVATSLPGKAKLYTWPTGALALSVGQQAFAQAMLGSGFGLSLADRDLGFESLLLGRFVCKVAIGALAARFERVDIGDCPGFG